MRVTFKGVGGSGLGPGVSGLEFRAFGFGVQGPGVCRRIKNQKKRAAKKEKDSAIIGGGVL